jgi:hypothetical protein
MHIPASMRARIPSAITDYLQTSVTASNVGREDRLVRGCIALSLILLGGFTLIGASHLSLITVAFLVLGGYFALTAALGSDPGYQKAGIDTRTDAELAERSEHEDAGVVYDLTDAPTGETSADYSPIRSLKR